MDIHEAIIALFNASSSHLNNLKAEVEEADEFFASGHYTEKQCKSVKASAAGQIDEIVEASDVLLDFLQILNRHSRSANNLREAEEELKQMLDIND